MRNRRRERERERERMKKRGKRKSNGECRGVSDPRQGGDSVGRGRRKIFLMSKDFQVLTQNGGRPFKSAC